jgi:hypothetical protein
MPVYNRFYWPEAPSHIGGPDTLFKLGPILAVEVAIPEALAQHLSDKNSPIPSPATGWALIDTGATITSVDGKVFSELGVPPVGVAQVGTASGAVQQQVYPARISFPGTHLKDLGFSQVVGCDLTGQFPPDFGGLIALIGRDLLRHFVFHYNGPGGFITISY